MEESAMKVYLNHRPSQRRSGSLGYRLILCATLAISLIHCSEPLPEEPNTFVSSSPSLRSGVIERCDGNAPDTIAFVARILEWDGVSELNYRVDSGSTTLISGSVDYDQIQIAFAVDPTQDVRLLFFAWSLGADTTYAQWPD
jgi:hypothetical protein